MSAAANTIECIEQLFGEKLLGVVPDWSNSEITATKALIFESGRALVLGDNGSYWVESAPDVERRIAVVRDDYEKGVGALAKLLKLAGRGTDKGGV